MVATSKWRGHTICFDNGQGVWVFVDTGQPSEEWPDRPCGHCGLANTPEGHDGCLGTLPGVRNACCGHGCINEAFIQYEAGGELRGRRAVVEFGRLINSKRERSGGGNIDGIHDGARAEGSPG